MTRRGEFELIAALRERIARAGAPEGSELAVASGDDCAVAELAGAVVIGVDALVDGVHFRRGEAPFAGVGHKALATALSDLAAMGAEAAHAYVQLGVPADVDDESLLELADGMGALAVRAGVAVAGGDVTASPVLFLAITVVGSTPSAADAVTRGGARPGDLLAVTGELGGAAAGLAVIDRPAVAGAVSPDTAAALRRRQLEPVPRLEAGRALAEAGVHAMIDLSDGLVADAEHMARASGAALRIDVDAVPVAAGVDAVARAIDRDPRELALSGGEDYELLAALPSDARGDAEAAMGALGLGLTLVGEVLAGEGVEFSSRGAAYRPAAGFDQLRPRQEPDDRA